jgi:hypothetical protein
VECLTDDDCTGDDLCNINNECAPGPIAPDCSSCDGIGTTLDEMACAIDLCDPAVLLSQTYTSPTSAATAGTYEAVAHFGDTTNDLAPLLNGSYALMATGPATGTGHNSSQGGSGMTDPFDSVSSIYDVMEWTLQLQAPLAADGIMIHYVYLSVEYDDWVGTQFNDKAYFILEAASTNSGSPTVINYGDCRTAGGYDFGPPDCDLPSEECCYIGPNSGYSECCWYPDFATCTTCASNHDIQGTGFECYDAAGPNCGMGDNEYYGSSTGWMVTEWPIDPGEVFYLTFHIHDTADHFYDSELIVDKVLFTQEVIPGTRKMP